MVERCEQVLVKKDVEVEKDEFFFSGMPGVGAVEGTVELAEFEVMEEEAGQRLDKILGAHFPDQSRSYFGGLCAQGR